MTDKNVIYLRVEAGVVYIVERPPDITIIINDEDLRKCGEEGTIHCRSLLERTFDNLSLEEHVCQWIEEEIEDSYEYKEDVVSDLMSHGCQSGMVEHLVHYDQTERFFLNYQDEISEMLTETIEETGYTPSELFGDKWDKSDPLALGKLNRNLLAWFAFEETASRIHICD